MEKIKRIIECPGCDLTERVCGMCRSYRKSATFSDYGVCSLLGIVAKECGYTCSEWACVSCGTCPKSERDLSDD